MKERGGERGRGRDGEREKTERERRKYMYSKWERELGMKREKSKIIK